MGQTKNALIVYQKKTSPKTSLFWRLLVEIASLICNEIAYPQLDKVSLHMINVLTEQALDALSTLSGTTFQKLASL